MKTLIIVPTYNEADNITELIKQVVALNLGVDILVVDDNSPDNTAQVVQGLQTDYSNLFLLSRPAKNGLGRAYLAGFAWAAERGYEAVVEMDADLSHDPAALPLLINALVDHDFVIGSRYVRGGGVVNWPWWRRALSRGGSLYARVILRSPFTDLTGGFNAWRVALLKKINLNTIKSNGYSFQIELKARALAAGGRGTEVPIIFTERRAGQSKMSGHIAAEAIWRVWQIAWRTANKKNLLTAALLLVILAITGLVYAPCLKGEFLNWDDRQQITENADLGDVSLTGLKKIFTSTYLKMYQPLTSLSYALELKFSQANAWQFHLDNIILHLFNLLLVFWLTKLLFGKNNLALITVALLAWHPLILESVGWISARSTLLYSFFFLSALIAYWQHLKTNKKIYYPLALVLFLLALFAKVLALSLPLILLLLDYFFYRRFTWKLLLKKLPFFALALVFGIIALNTRDAMLDFYTASLQYPWYNIILVWLYPLGFFLDKLIAPNNLSVFVPYPLGNTNWLPLQFYLAPLTLVLALTALIIWRKKNIVILAGGWYFLNLIFTIPVSAYSKTLVADRYIYLAGLGVFWLTALAYEKLRAWKPWLKIFLPLALIFYLALLALTTFSRTFVWQTSLNLWHDATKWSPRTAFVYLNLGNAQRDAGQIDDAIASYQRALEIFPTNPDAFNGLGMVYFDLKKYPEAIDYFNQAIRHGPRDSIYYYNRGCALAALEDQKNALVDYDLAVKLSERDNHQLATYYAAAGGARYKLGDLNGALAAYDRAIKLQPKISEGYFYRGLIKIKLAQKDSGCQDLRVADKLGYKDAKEELTKNCQ